MDCITCKQTIRDDSAIYCAGKCEGIFHYDCAGINKTAAQALAKYPRNLKFLCQACEQVEMINFIAVLKQFNEYVEEKKSEDNKRDKMIEKLSEKIESVSEKMVVVGKDIHENVKDVMLEMKEMNVDNTKKKKTFAEIMKCKSDPIVIIKPKEKQSSNTTRDDVKQKIDPGSIPVTGLKNIANGAIAIQFENKQESNQIKIMAEEKMGDKYEIITPMPLKPRVKIMGLSEKPEKDDVSVMLNQNKFLNNCEVKVISIYEDKNSRFKYNRFNVVVEVDTENFNKIMEARHVIMKWDRCMVVEGLSITRCYKCSGYNHKSTDCKNNRACPKCSEDHEEKDCKCETNVCVNCKMANDKLNMKLNINHGTWDRKCEVFKRKMEVARRRIQYSI
jgi:hypothetical protein